MKEVWKGGKGRATSVLVFGFGIEDRKHGHTDLHFSVFGFPWGLCLEFWDQLFYMLTTQAGQLVVREVHSQSFLSFSFTARGILGCGFPLPLSFHLIPEPK